MDGSPLRSRQVQSLLICAMGGEGGGVLTSWVVEAARAQGLAVQATSVPGVAQRTGGTTYYIEMAERDPAGRAPVFALTPVPGQVDVVLSSELVEGARAARMGFAVPDRTLTISSTHRIFLMPEKMAMGDGRIAPDALRATIEARSRRAVLLDMDALAQRYGVPISPVLLGALAGTGSLPIDSRLFAAAIEASGIAVERNLAAFEAAAKAVGEPAEAKSPALAPDDFIIGGGVDEAALAAFPPAARNVIARGADRLRDYQDSAYTSLYLRRLEPFAQVEPELLKETARHLALRMSYEDVIRVAQHKARVDRFQRIRNEVGGNEEPIEVQDFFKPGVREFADILPPSLARPLLRRAEKGGRLARLHIGMKVRTTTILGYLRIWTLARLRPWRRRTHRYEVEQQQIEAWLSLIERAVTKGDHALAFEIAGLARLIKGYGDTHVRGLSNYQRIVEAVVMPALASEATTMKDVAATVRSARDAALADPEGDHLGRIIEAAGALRPAA